MARAVIAVVKAGPLVTIQDQGRPGLMRYGISASGPMDRGAYAIANAALGNVAPLPAIEVSPGGLELEVAVGAVTVAVAGGGFSLHADNLLLPSWAVVTLRPGMRLALQPGPWGSWSYVGFAGRLAAPQWLGSVATHTTSGFGGGRLQAGHQLVIEDAATRPEREGSIVCPVWARPRHEVKVVLGPQERFFSRDVIDRFLAEPFALTDAYDRMGVRLAGPALKPAARLDMPSEAISRGSVQVNGEGIATVLLADHQTTGGYPKIATVTSDQLDGFVQLRSRKHVVFVAESADASLARVRTKLRIRQEYLARLRDSAQNGRP
jgi:allophanate hydrolase